MKKHFGVLNRRPNASKVTGLPIIRSLSYVEKYTGYKDRKENQLCSSDEGQTTPYVEARRKSFEHYVNNAYLVAEKVKESEVKEAERLISELDILTKFEVSIIDGNDEEIERAQRFARELVLKNNKRKEEIVLRLSEIKALVEAVDDKLIHHIESAEDLLNVHLANYWSGILKASPNGETCLEPIYITRAYNGRQHYCDDRDELLRKIAAAIEIGGDSYEE